MSKKPIEDQNLSVVFFVISVVFFATLAYMIYDEAIVRRPWKGFQKEYYETTVEKLGVDLEQAKADLAEQVADATEYRQASARLEEMTASGSEYQKQLTEAEAALHDRKVAMAPIVEKLAFIKADYEAARYLVEKASLEEAPANEIEKVFNDFKEIERQRDEQQAKVDEEQAKLEAAEKRLVDIKAEERKLQEVVDRYEKTVNELADRRNQIEERYLSLTTAAGFEEKLVPKPEAIKQIIDNDLGVVDRCTTCHMGIDKAGFENQENPHKTHPHVEKLLVRAHTQIGCSPCHFGRGRALTTENAHGSEKHWLWPLKEGAYVESTCRSCHSEEDKIEYAPTYTKGHALVKELGCFGCHPIAQYPWERVGPALNKVAAKADFTWLTHWIHAPKEYLPKTRMPYFYLSPEESREVAAYLVASSSESNFAAVDLGAANPERGETLLNDVGCLGCHSMGPKDNDNGPVQGPNLTEVGKKTNGAWLFNWLKNPQLYNPETKMPNLRLTDDEALDITAYLVGLKGDGNGEEIPLPQGEELTQLVAKGEETIKRYGCFGCHHINGLEDRGRIGTDLSDWGNKDIHMLDFGHQEIPHTREAWMSHKLKAPRSFDLGRILPEKDKLRMPNFELADDEVEAVVVAITSLMTEPIPDVRAPMPDSEKRHLTQKEQELVEGRRIIEKYNCAGCHQVERLGEDEFWGGDIQAYIDDPGYYPPIIYGEGKKVQSEWLYNFLKNVKTIRPWMKVRMPSFPFTDDEVVALVKYFVAIDEAKWPYVFMEDKEFPEREVLAGMHLLKGYQCISCHAVNQEMVDAIVDKSSLAPNLSLVSERLRFDWLHDWILNPAQIAPGTRMPDNFPDMGEQKDASFGVQMMQAPQNADLKAWFDENYSAEEQEKFLADSNWVTNRMQDYLWNFDAEEYLAKFPWTPPAPVEEVQEEEDWSDEDWEETGEGEEEWTDDDDDAEEEVESEAGESGESSEEPEGSSSQGNDG
jgi:cytochrome c2